MARGGWPGLKVALVNRVGRECPLHEWFLQERGTVRGACRSCIGEYRNEAGRVQRLWIKVLLLREHFGEETVERPGLGFPGGDLNGYHAVSNCN